MPGIDSFTVLMLHCDGADGSNVFTDVSPAAHTVSRVGIKVDTGQSKFGGASAQFQKTANQEISSPDSNDWTFGSGDFTIDFWAMFNSSGSDMTLICQGDGGSTTTAWELRWNPSVGQLVANFYDASTGTAFGAARVFSPNTGTWQHIALVRDVNSFKMFANGNKLGSSGDVTGLSVKNISTRLTIGNWSDGTLPFDGWLDEIRISKGIARWTTNFSPPTAAYDSSSAGTPVSASDSGSGADSSVATIAPTLISVVEAPAGGGVDANTVLMLHADNFADGSFSFVDSSQYAHVMSLVGSPTTTTAQKVFGFSSARFSSGNYITTPDSADFDFGTGPFTIDFWARWNSLSGDQAILGKWDTTGGAFYVMRSALDAALYFFWKDLSNVTQNVSFTFGPATNTWYHLAFVSTGSAGQFQIYVNGVHLMTTPPTIAGIHAATKAFTVGFAVGGSTALNGWMDELRISKGVARWTADFIPPAAPYGAGGNNGDDVATVFIPVVKSATDSGSGSDSSSVYITLALTASDSGSDVEISSWSAKYDVVDTGLGIEISTLKAAYPVVDSGLGSEISSLLFTPLSVSDSGSGSEISSFAFTAFDSGSGSEISTLVVQPFSRTDLGLNNDVATLAVKSSVTDSDVSGDISSSSAVLSVSDNGSGSEAPSFLAATGIFAFDSALGTEIPAISTGTAKVVFDDSFGNEIATIKIVSLVTDETSAGIEGTATVSQNVSDSATGSDVSPAVAKFSTDSATGNEISVFGSPLFLTDSGSGDDISSFVLKAVVESGTSTDVSTLAVQHLRVESGTATTIASLTSSAQAFDSGLLGNEIATNTVKASAVDSGLGNEIALRLVTGLALSASDSGSSDDDSFLHAGYDSSEFGIWDETTQILGNFALIPSGKVSIVRTGSIPGRMLSVGSSQPARLISTKKPAPTIEAVK